MWISERTRRNCSVAECFQEKSRRRWNEQVCQEYLGACAVLVLIQIAVVVCCAYYAVQVDLTVGTSLLEYITISYRGGVALDSSCDVVYSNDTDSVVFDKAMTSLKCCGAKHANDFAAHSERWERNVTCYGQPFNMEVPVACCRKETPNARNTPEEMVFVHLERCLRAGSPTYSQTQPCIPEIKKMFHKKTMIVVTLNGTTIIGLVFSFLFTMCHRNNLRERGSESMSTILSAIYDAERRSCHSRGKTSNPQSLSPSVNSFTMHTFKSSHDPVRRKRPIHHSPATSRVKSPDRMQSSPVEIHIAPAESRERGYSPTTSKHREVVDGPTNVSTNFTH
ncbi:hypothetical protein LSAT2_019057 [Lamellibrachia satsuma]|nr:hypothetical protein LSAT2_019057 [Lamellibrachia satsuma]